MKAYRGGRGTSPFILNLSIRWKSLNTALPPRGRTLAPIEWGLVDSHNSFGRPGEEQNLLSLPGFKPQIM